MNKQQANAIRSIVQRDMAAARSTYERLVARLGYKISEGALIAREATLAAIRRLDAVLEQMENPEVHKELIMGTDEKPIVVSSLEELRKRVKEDGPLDLQVLIDPKNPALSNIPKTVPKQDS